MRLTLIETEDGTHGAHAGGHPLPTGWPVEVVLRDGPTVGQRLTVEFAGKFSPLFTGTVKSISIRDGVTYFRTKRSTYKLEQADAQEDDGD